MALLALLVLCVASRLGRSHVAAFELYDVESPELRKDLTQRRIPWSEAAVEWDDGKFLAFWSNLQLQPMPNTFEKGLEQTHANKNEAEKWLATIIGGVEEMCAWLAFYTTDWFTATLPLMGFGLVFAVLVFCCCLCCADCVSHYSQPRFRGAAGIELEVRNHWTSGQAFMYYILLASVSPVFVMLIACLLMAFAVLLLILVLSGSLFAAALFLLGCFATTLLLVVSPFPALNRLLLQPSSLVAYSTQRKVISAVAAGSFGALVNIAMLYIDISMLAAGLNALDLIPSCGVDIDAKNCSENGLVIHWFDDIWPGFADLHWMNAEKGFSWAFKLNDHVEELVDGDCKGLEVLTLFVPLCAALLLLLWIMPSGGILASMARAKTSSKLAGWPVLFILLRSLQSLAWKIVEFAMAAGSPAVVHLGSIGSALECAYHGDATLSLLGYTLVVTSVVLSVVVIVVVVLGHWQWRSSHRNCLALLGAWLEDAGCAAGFASVLEQCDVPVDVEYSSDLLVEYLWANSRILAASVHLFPLGAVAARFLDCIHCGDPVIVRTTGRLPATKLSIAGLGEKGLAMLRFMCLIAIVLTTDATLRATVLYLCICIVLLEAACTAVSSLQSKYKKMMVKSLLASEGGDSTDTDPAGEPPESEHLATEIADDPPVDGTQLAAEEVASTAVDAQGMEESGIIDQHGAEEIECEKDDTAEPAEEYGVKAGQGPEVALDMAVDDEAADSGTAGADPAADDLDSVLTSDLEGDEDAEDMTIIGDISRDTKEVSLEPAELLPHVHSDAESAGRDMDAAGSTTDAIFPEVPPGDFIIIDVDSIADESPRGEADDAPRAAQGGPALEGGPSPTTARSGGFEFSI